MIKQTVTYIDFNEKEATEDLYFHLSKMELVNMELSHQGGLSTVLPEMIKSGDMGKVVQMFQDIVLKAYGTRSEDGKRFAKDEAVTKDFMTSPAFDALFTILISSPEAAANFITGLMPRDMVEQLNAQETPPLDQLTMPGQDAEPPPWIRDDRDPTNDELMRMSTDQLREVMQRKMGGASTTVPSQPKQVL